MRHHMKRSHDAELRGFASDNYSGVHPEVLDALAEANGGHQVAYGGDEYTARLQDVIGQHFGDGASVWPMFNGTGANVVGLQSMLPRWGAVICADTAHIHVDEGGAPEKSAGIKLLPVPTPPHLELPECEPNAGRSRWSARPPRCSCWTSPSSTRRCRTSRPT